MFTDLDFSFLIEILAFLAIVAGVGLIYLPASLIIGGLILIAAIELQPKDEPKNNA